MSNASVGSIAGTIDECRPEHEVGSVGGAAILLPGDRVAVRGWALAHDRSDFTVELTVGERTITVARSIKRFDVSSDPDLATCGFEILVDIDEPTSGKTVEIGLNVRGDGNRCSLHPAHRVFTATRLEPSAEPLPASRTPYGRFRFVADADPRHPRHGWGGRRTMRPDSAIAIRGWILDRQKRAPASVSLIVEGDGTRYRAEAALVGDGEATALAGAETWFSAGFACALSPWTLVPGLYFVTAVLMADDGALERGPSEAFQVVDDDQWEPPLFLPLGAQAADASAVEVGPLEVVRGAPIVVRGLAADPATGCGAATFVRFGTSRALPVPPVRTDPKRFAGIADTAVLAPGVHRLQILLQPTYPGFWHLIAERDVFVREKPSGIPPNSEQVIEHG